MSQRIEPVFLSGKRVDLRPVDLSDSELFVKWVNDPRIRDFILNAMPLSVTEEEEWIRKLPASKPNSFVMTIIEKGSGRPIGNMGVHRINWRDRHCTTGAIIGEPEFWGKGYGTEAKLLLLRYLFDSLNLHRVCSAAIAFNKRSIAYSLKCGYKIEGRQRKHVFRKGKYHDLVHLAVFKPDFERSWKRYMRGLR
jgi:RimJ/RimL family protein N-acetyltransferase